MSKVRIETIATDLGKVTLDEWRAALESLSNRELSKLERRVSSLFVELATLMEWREPGGLANRLVALGDVYPPLTYDIPAYMTGGRDLLDIAARDGDSTMHNIICVLWPKVREEFRAQLSLYFSRLAASENGAVAPRKGRSRRGRVMRLARGLRYLFRTRRPPVIEPQETL